MTAAVPTLASSSSRCLLPSRSKVTLATWATPCRATCAGTSVAFAVFADQLGHVDPRRGIGDPVEQLLDFGAYSPVGLLDRFGHGPLQEAAAGLFVALGVFVEATQ